MKKHLLTLLTIILITPAILAQSDCEDCDPEVTADFCFKQELWNEHCAMFEDGATDFKLKVGKKTKSIPVKNYTDTQGLLAIANTKKLKISASDMLFIQSALKSWEVESRKIGYADEPSGLGIKIISEGTGDLPEKGKEVTVHYTGWLMDGTKFDSSVDRGVPFKFPLGKGRVIKGWDEGVSKLKKGTKALLRIPPNLGYGTRGAGKSIPPNSTLIFEIELL